MSAPQPAFKPRTAREAAHWLTLCMDGELPPEQAQAFRRWRSADPDNERAWQHIESLRGRLAGLQPTAGYRSLSQGGGSRRRVVKALVMLALVGGTAGLAYREPWRDATGLTYHNGASAPRPITLADGSQLTLDADSTLEVDFDARQRTLRLLRGRLLISTGHDPLRAFSVKTAHGSVLALGTRFVVHALPERTEVALFEGALKLSPLHTTPQLLSAGERTRFTAARIDSSTPAGREPLWGSGALEADNMRLEHFIAELARYRPGLLRCAREVADLRISGVYPLADSDAVLDTLTQSLPVRINRRSRYWVTVSAR